MDDLFQQFQQKILQGFLRIFILRLFKYFLRVFLCVFSQKFLYGSLKEHILGFFSKVFSMIIYTGLSIFSHGILHAIPSAIHSRIPAEIILENGPEMLLASFFMNNFNISLDILSGITQ